MWATGICTYFDLATQKNRHRLVLKALALSGVLKAPAYYIATEKSGNASNLNYYMKIASNALF
jgi:hypothetical protein